ITLTSGELLVSKSVDLLGAGANSLAVNGNHASRVFHIASGKTVTLAGMTVTNGNMTINGGYGGGIYNDHATLTVSNCIVSGNTATNFGYGGGIYTDPSSAPDIWTLTVVGSTISGNSATLDGGGIDIGRGSALNVISST